MVGVLRAYSVLSIEQFRIASSAFCHPSVLIFPVRTALEARVTRFSGDLQAFRASVAQNAAKIAVAILGDPNFTLCSKRELRFGNRGSLTVAIAGSKAGLYFDHELGEGGDLIDLIRSRRNCSFEHALSYMQELVRLPFPTPSPTDGESLPTDDASTTSYAWRVWNPAKGIVDTPAASFLFSRNVLEMALEIGEDVLRFHPDCPFQGSERRPCMLALMRDARSNEPRAIQRTAIPRAFLRAGSLTGAENGTCFREKVGRMGQRKALRSSYRLTRA